MESVNSTQTTKIAPTVPNPRDEVPRVNRLRTLLPGVMLALLVAAVSYGASLMTPVLSPLIVAIILGVVITNTVSLPAFMAAGVDFSAKKLLRAGIVLLGLRLVLSDIAALGAPMLGVVVCVVVVGILGTLLIGRILKIPSGLNLLISCGFSICGAAAVAGVAGVSDPNDEAEEDTITAVALVVIFGTLMIPLLPFLAGVLGLDSHAAAMWAGASVHEIAQVVAIGGILGGGAMKVAVVVKLARVLLLAPVAAVVSIRQRIAFKRTVEARGVDETAHQAKMPPLIPPFIIGFLAMVLLRSFVDLPSAALTVGGALQTALLAAAMFGLGCGVKIRKLSKVGLRPFILATLATVLVSAIAYAGVTLVG